MKIAPGFVGIDISKNHLDVFVSDAGRSWRIANEPAAIDRLIEGLPADAFVLFEATGTYDRKLRLALAAARLRFARVNPSDARHFAKAIGFLAKTDAIDARMLAIMAERLQPAPQDNPSAEREALANLVKRRDQLVATRQQERTRRAGQTDPFALESLARHLAYLDGEIKIIEAELAMTIAASSELAEHARLLASCKGVGTVTRATLLALLPELGSRSHKAIAALAGLAPFNCDTGKHHGLRQISRGRKRVRDALYMASVWMARNHPKLSIFFQTLRSKGKPFKVALIALARKLLVILNAILRDRRPYHQAA
jgi:transposase